MISINENTQVFWTQKVTLNRIIDPLALSGFKFVEDEFLKGIITQTERLRYYTFLTWAWNKIKNKNLQPSTILNMEKVFTLACAHHHLGKSDYPRGIRNRQDGETFLEENNFIDITQLTHFGRNNKQGYGNYYYAGSLAALHIFWRDDESIKFSDVGEKIAQVYDKFAQPHENIFIEGKFEKAKLSQLINHCACQVRESEEEINLWRKIFFGFTKQEGFGNNIVFDGDRYNRFMKGKEDVQKDVNKNNRLRRLTLFIIMKIINEAQPDRRELLQSIRDGFYFGEVKRNKEIRKIDYSGVRRIKNQLEVYVHNLYFMDILEYIFAYILEVLQTKPQGATLDEVLDSLDFEEIEKNIDELFSDFKIEEIKPKKIMAKINNFNTSLEEPINERNIFYDFREANDKNRVFADIFILFLLLKRRYRDFNDEQKSLIENVNLEAGPKTLYKQTDGKSIKEILRMIFSTVINCHRYAAARKLLYDNTRAWLFTVEENKLFFYDRLYDFGSYAESKWTNVVDLLYDMRLIDYDEKYTLSEDGKLWLSKVG
ncbi:MAG: hypothetical protein U9O96_03355 [Candidatus Thermoplasmatota archaeon]|nr:hypothetical protein [Candidatus Thermoplasmatota archaeon]